MSIIYHTSINPTNDSNSKFESPTVNLIKFNGLCYSKIRYDVRINNLNTPLQKTLSAREACSYTWCDQRFVSVNIAAREPARKEDFAY